MNDPMRLKKYKSVQKITDLENYVKIQIKNGTQCFIQIITNQHTQKGPFTNDVIYKKN